MLTVDKLKAIATNEIFDSGECINSSKDIYMTDTNVGEMMIWIAKKGSADDWAIYLCWKWQGWQFCETQGQKVCNLENIKKLVPCDEEVIKKYRY